MAISKNAGRQEIVAARISVGYADISSDAAVSEAIVQLPANAVVVGGFVNVTEVFNSTTSDVADLGDGVVADRYSATPINLAALGVTVLDVTGYQYPNTDEVDLQWTAGATGTATTGAFDLVIEYIVDGRAAFSQG